MNVALFDTFMSLKFALHFIIFWELKQYGGKMGIGLDSYILKTKMNFHIYFL